MIARCEKERRDGSVHTDMITELISNLFLFYVFNVFIDVFNFKICLYNCVSSLSCTLYCVVL